MTLAATFDRPDLPTAPRLTAPRPEVPPADLPLLSLARIMRRSGIAAWPARAYRELFLHRRILGVDCYLLNDPAAARQTLAQEATIYERPIGMRRLLRPLTRAGLLLAEGENWRQQRRMLAPGFTPKSIEASIPRFYACGETMIEGLGAGGRMTLGPVFERATIDVVGRVMFSLSLGAHADWLARLREAFFSPAFRPSLWDFLARKEDDFGHARGPRAAYGRMCAEIVDAIIDARMKVGSAAVGSADVVDMLANAIDADTGKPLSRDAIRDQCATLLTTGSISSSLVMFWTVYLLSRDRAEQARVRAEVARFPPDRVRCMADLENWPRLSATIAEAMRLYPPVPALSRVARQETEILGTVIRPGALVTVSTWVMHRHLRHWDAPDAFMPERFIEGPARPPAFMPFGVGPRICIGLAFSTLEATLLMAQLFARFSVTLEDPRPVTPVAMTVIAPDIDPLFRLEPDR